MKQAKKAVALVLVLVLVWMAAGCKNSNASGDLSTKLEAPSGDLDTGIGAGQSLALTDALTFTAVKMEMEVGRSKVYVDVENTSDSAVLLEWKDLRMNGWTAGSDPKFENWFPDLWAVEIGAHEVYQEVFFVEYPSFRGTVQYADAEIDVEVSNSDQSQTESLPVKLLLGDIEIVDLTSSGGGSAPASDPVIHIAEQEIYNANGLFITVPEQTLGVGSGLEGIVYQLPKLHFENQRDERVFISYLDVTVNGQTVYEGSRDTYFDAVPEAGETLDADLAVVNGLKDAVDSGSNSGEISFTLYLSVDMETALDEASVTIPFAVAAE